MTNREIILAAIALEHSMDLEEVKEMYRRWDKMLETAEASSHSGDCTNECHPCYRCIVDEAKDMIPVYRYLFGL